jgi:hypothetical protein
MSKIQTPEKLEELPLSVVKNMIILATSGFGVVVALAWNEFIRSVISNYVDPLLGKGGGVASLFIYAMVMTALAVIVTMQLGALEKRLERLRGIVSHPSEVKTPTPKVRGRGRPKLGKLSNK